MSLLRQLALVLPAAWLICLWNVDLVWLAFPLVEGVTCLLALALYRRMYRNKIMNI